MVFSLYNWWYSVLSDLYVKNPSMCFLDSYDRFTSNTSLSWRLWTFYVKTLSSLTITNVSCCIPLFLDGYECFTLEPFLSWWLWMFHVKTLSSFDGYERFMLKTFICWRLQTFHFKTLAFLTVTNFSHQNPWFLNDCEHFKSKTLIQQTARFSKILVFLFSFLLYS